MSKYYQCFTVLCFKHFFDIFFPAKLRRVKDEEWPLKICLDWELENVHNHRLVLQENETGEIDVCIAKKCHCFNAESTKHNCSKQHFKICY